MLFAHKECAYYLGWADSVIQVGSDSLLLCSFIYKFVTTNMFNCHGTIAFIQMLFVVVHPICFTAQTE